MIEEKQQEKETNKIVKAVVEQVKKQEKEAKKMMKEGLISTDDKLVNNLLPVIEDHEGLIEHAYADSRGYISNGLGKNINDLETFKKQPFMTAGGILATNEEKEAEYNRIRKINNQIGNNTIASAYINEKNGLFIKDKTFLRNQAKDHLKDNLKSVRKKFKNFDEFPEEAQTVIVEMEYNMGGRFKESFVENGEQKGWPKFFKAVEDKKWDKAAIQSKGIHVNDARNKWRFDTLNSIK